MQRYVVKRDKPPTFVDVRPEELAEEDAIRQRDDSWSGPLGDVVRQRRDALLRESDWSQLLDAPLTEAKRQEWINYRQALRDVPQTFATPSAVSWPGQPSRVR